MKGFLAWFMVACFLLASSAKAEAFLFGKKKEQTKQPAPAQQSSAQPANPPQAQEPANAEAPKVEPVKPPAAQSAAEEAKRALMQKKRNELNNTQWQIELIESSGKGKKENDTVEFKNNQIVSAAYGKRGFPSTNYTLTVQNDSSLVWETMQTSEKDGIAFWRGEISPDMKQMRGVLSHRIDDQTSLDYSFASVSKKNIPPPAEVK